MIKNRFLAAAVTAAIVLPNIAIATNGMNMYGNGTKANGRAGVGIAIADSSISGADNPAAMVRVGNRIDFGVQIFDPDRSLEISGNAPGSPRSADYKGDGNNDGPFYIPEGGFNYMLNDNMSIGLTVVGTGGMNTNYDNVAMFDGRAMAAGGVPSTTGINLEVVRILPTLSYKINDQHSVGVSLQIAYQQFKAWGLSNFDGAGAQPGCQNTGDCQLSETPNKMNGKGRDDAWGFGLSLGWQGQLTDSLTVGAVYNSKISMDEFDDYKGLLAEQGGFDIAENYGIGVAFQATDKLMLSLDVQEINYSGVDSIGNELNSGPNNTGANLFNPNNFFGSNNGSGFGWDDITIIKFGTEYQWNEQLTLRAGYSHSDNPISKDQTMFNALAPAVIEDHATIGMTYILPQGSEISLFYMHAFENEVKGSNSIPAGFGGGEADIKMSQDAWGIAYGWNF